MSERGKSFWRTPNGLAATVLIGIAGYYLLAEHQAHVFAALPWLILLSCPLLHVFMHRGHGGHGHGGGDQGHHDEPGERG
jgi:hypothetical protein